MERVVFLDRDGVINRDSKGYIKSAEEFKLLPNTIKALKLLSARKYKLIIITNQSGIGKGLYTTRDFCKVNQKMVKELEKNNVKLDAIYYCPHEAETACECRKPNLGMLKQAQKDFKINTKKSFMIGDKTADIEWGRRAGCKTILVKTGYGGKDKRFSVKPDYVAKDLLEAAKIVASSTH